MKHEQKDVRLTLCVVVLTVVGPLVVPCGSSELASEVELSTSKELLVVE